MCYFWGMKSTFAFCTALAAAAVVAIVTTSVAAPDSKKSDDKSAPAADEPIVAKAPDKVFTNSVDMILLAMPGDYWAGEYLVTQKEYSKVMGSNPSTFAGENNPVDSVTYEDAIAFCEKLTAQDIEKKFLPGGYSYTLPTEGEWESLVAGAELDSAVTSQNVSRSGTRPVGSLAANSLGLYDIRGNLMEFCLSDGSKPFRVLRGGSWQDHIEVNLRTEFRWYCKPDEKMNIFGFRVLLKKAGATGSAPKSS
jgi:formylglycine-generating enzyme required for sulfatase activity